MILYLYISKCKVNGTKHVGCGFISSLLHRPDVFVSLLYSWVSLVSKNYEIERAIVQLENELSQLRQQQGDENKENIRQDF